MDTMEQQGNGKPPQKGGIGPVLGIIIIIILIALGGLYYFTIGVNEIRNQNTESPMSPEQEAVTIVTQGATSNLDDIQADVDATDFSGIDDALLNIEEDLQAQ